MKIFTIPVSFALFIRTFYKSGEVPVRELERFHADGRSGDLNRYVILKRL